MYPVSDLSVRCRSGLLDQSPEVLLVLPASFSRPVIYRSLRSVYLSLPYALLVLLVLEREGHDQSLFKGVPVDQPLLVESLVIVFVRIKLIDVEQSGAIMAPGTVQLPSLGAQSPVAYVFSELLERLRNDICSVLDVVELAVGL